MKRLVAGLAGAVVLLSFPSFAAAQCEGGVTVAGRYGADGSYIPGGCAYTNPTTPGQLYPSGASPTLSTNPAQAGSRLPGQQLPADLIPVNSSDLGPAPSLVNVPQPAPRPLLSGPSLGPGVPTTAALGVPNPAAVVDPAVPAAALPSELPPSGAPVLTGNRAVSGSLVPVYRGVDLVGAGSNLGNPAYANSSLPPAAAPAEEPTLPPPPARGGPAYEGEGPAEVIFITY
jgi:hypothetical protein